MTGPKAYELVRAEEKRLERLAELVKAPADNVVRRVETLLEERRALQRRIDELMRGGGDQVQSLIARARSVNGAKLVVDTVQAADVNELKSLGDALREKLGSGVGVIAAPTDEKATLLVVVTDDLRDRGVRADELVREIAAAAGGRGGGKPHMAQAGIPDRARVSDAMAKAPGVVESALAAHP